MRIWSRWDFKARTARVAAFVRDWKADRQREQQTSGRGTFVALAFCKRCSGPTFKF